MANLIERIDQSLRNRGWRYDAGQEQFMAEDREIELDELTELLPELTLEELNCYQHAKHAGSTQRAVQ